MCSTTKNVNFFLSNQCLDYYTYTEHNQESFDELFENNFPNNELHIPGINDPSSEELYFQQLLIDVCNYSDNGRFCRKPLLELCSSYTRDDLINPTIKQMCGCYLPDEFYSADIVRSCDNVCSNISTINYYSNSEQLRPVECISNACIIDGVNIEAVNSNVGDITFTQLCPLCSGAANCQCIINDINIISKNSSLGKIDINQNCGSVSKCFSKTENGTQQEVDCDEYFAEFGTNVPYTEQIRTISYNVIIVVSVIIALLIILFIVAFIYGLITPKLTYLTYATNKLDSENKITRYNVLYDDILYV